MSTRLKGMSRLKNDPDVILKDDPAYWGASLTLALQVNDGARIAVCQSSLARLGIHFPLTIPKPDAELLTISGLARRLHIPQSWLEEEAIAGRIPGVCCDGMWIFNFSAVQKCLLKRAETFPGSSISEAMVLADYDRKLSAISGVEPL